MFLAVIFLAGLLYSSTCLLTTCLDKASF